MSVLDLIPKRDDDDDRLAALAWLDAKARTYPGGLFLPPLQRRTNEDRARPFATLHLHATYDIEYGGHLIDTAEWYDGEMRAVAYPSCPDDVVSFLADGPLSHRYASYQIVTDGGEAGILDVLIETCGRALVERGYTIEPCMGNGGIGWLTIRKGKRKWVLTTAETMTGLDLPSLLAFAGDAARSIDGRVMPSWLLYTACAAYSTFLRDHFGCALRPTISMIASASAMRTMPHEAMKWRPSPLLVSMEREGIGYRGGILWHKKHRGEMHRIDVNRQYTSMLSRPLPLTSCFGKWRGFSSGEHGVFVCTVRSPYPLQYPVGIWRGEEVGFERTTLPAGECVTVLHTSEFDALSAWGCDIEVGYGLRFVETFDLAEYVERIAEVCATNGRTSPIGRATKPMGNMVYGKFGQKPGRWNLLYAVDSPDESWSPYISPDGRDITGVWERYETKYTMGMHVEIASHITGYARAQTMATLAFAESIGLHPVRAHTDSITTVGDPRSVMELDDEKIGEWKYERFDHDGIIEGASVFADDETGHVAGFSNVPRSVLVEMHGGGEVLISREKNMPREGWYRRRHMISRRLVGERRTEVTDVKDFRDAAARSVV